MKEIDEDKAIDLFSRVEAHNFDDGYKALEAILKDKNCDLGTVSFIYWRSSPDFYRRYATEKDVTPGNLEGWRFVHNVERMLLSGEYPELIRFDPKTETHTGYTSDPSILVRDLPAEVYKVTGGTIGPGDMIRPPGKVLAAAREDDVSRLKVALEAVDGPNFKYGDWSPLITAANSNALNAIKYLLDNGADIDFKGRDNYRAIHEARTVRTVKLLLEYGAKVDLKCTFGTATHLAAHDRWNGCEDGVIEELIQGGAKPNVKDRNGETALHAAAHYGRVANFKTLLAAGWDLNAVDKKGLNVLHHCVDFPGNNFTSSIDRTEMLVELLKLGVSPDAETNAGQSAKALAAENAKYNKLGKKEQDKILELLEIECG